MKRRSQITSKKPSPSPSSSSHPSGNDKRTLKVKRTKDETRGSSGSDGARATSRCKLEEALECQVCLDVAVSPIYSCNEGGHVLCYICHGKLAVPKKCPSCSSQGFQVNAALERQAQKLEYRIKCANAEAGCKEKVLSTDFKGHLETYCYFRNITCKSSGCNSSSVKFHKFVAHRQQKHNLPILIQPAGGVVNAFKISNSTAIYLPGRYSEWMISFDNKFFILRTNLTDSIFHIWMAIMGDDKEAMQYFAKISLFGKQKLPGNEASYSWTLPVTPYYEDPATAREKTKSVFGSMSRKIFMSMVDTIDAFYLFKMKVEVIKMK